MKNPKTRILLLIFILFIKVGNSQPPQAFKYQACVIDSNGNVVVNQDVGLRFTFVEDSLGGNDIYTESHIVNTSDNGMVNIILGVGTPIGGKMQDIEWGVHSYFLKVEIDPLNLGNFVHMGTSQLLSVPYALYAENVANGNENWNLSGNELYAMNNGFVSIGSDDPEEKLHVDGNIKTDDTLKFKGYVNEGAGFNNPGQLLIGQRDIKIGYKSDNFGNILIGNSLYGKSVFQLDLTGNGNIGIGTDVFHETTSGYSNLCIGMYTGYNLSTGNNNVFLGPSAGEHISTGTFNLCMGHQSGNGRNGSNNIFIGDRAGYAWGGGGNQNIMLGNYAGYLYNASNSNCVFIGNYAGYGVNDNDNVFIGPNSTGRASSGTNNIFIGNQVGMNYNGDNILLIDNKNDNSLPFIMGDMENDLLEFNADIEINGKSSHQSVSVGQVLNLNELATFPANPQEGDLIYVDDTLRFYTGAVWRNLW
ncbi:MAG: hypothetical protein K9G76_12520 [Bacteroidales bacterium]|nr:hypothetical protein [Bacteroidales bacterium]MCF8405423.1 hypothetical protein [Bacteroidales bacterium]